MTEQQKLTFTALQQRLDSLMLRDRLRFSRRLHGVKKVKNPESQQAILQEMAQEISQAAGKVLLREAARPAITYPENLPVSQKKQEILEAVRDHQVVIVAGETGSGKTTLLKSISARLAPQNGEILYEGASLYGMSEAERRRLLRTEWGVVHQHPLDGLRRQVSAGGNIGERLMATGARHYGNIRETAQRWLTDVEIPASRIDDLPTTFSGGMQQRLQIARNLVTHPKLVFMDEPTGGLDVSVQARLLDLLRGLVVELNLAVVIVTHDLGVARLLADRLLVMKQGQVVESGLTDRVLDDPHHPYTQLLVSSVLQN